MCITIQIKQFQFFFNLYNFLLSPLTSIVFQTYIFFENGNNFRRLIQTECNFLNQKIITHRAIMKFQYLIIPQKRCRSKNVHCPSRFFIWSWTYTPTHHTVTMRWYRLIFSLVFHQFFITCSHIRQWTENIRWASDIPFELLHLIFPTGFYGLNCDNF